jgi:hypothetical protein
MKAWGDDLIGGLEPLLISALYEWVNMGYL